MKTKPLASRELAKICCAALAEKKAVDLRVLDVGELSSLTNFLVIATGTSEPHLRALRVELTKALAAADVSPVRAESLAESGWIVVDAFDVMVHLLTPEMRDRYGLENLWKDAAEVAAAALLAPAPRKPRGKAAAKPARKPARPKAKPRQKP
jgi:ribosome-associated protein